MTYLRFTLHCPRPHVSAGRFGKMAKPSLRRDGCTTSPEGVFVNLISIASVEDPLDQQFHRDFTGIETGNITRKHSVHGLC